MCGTQYDSGWHRITGSTLSSGTGPTSDATTGDTAFISILIISRINNLKKELE